MPEPMCAAGLEIGLRCDAGECFEDPMKMEPAETDPARQVVQAGLQLGFLNYPACRDHRVGMYLMQAGLVGTTSAAGPVTGGPSLFTVEKNSMFSRRADLETQDGLL